MSLAVWCAIRRTATLASILWLQRGAPMARPGQLGTQVSELRATEGSEQFAPSILHAASDNIWRGSAWEAFYDTLVSQ
jgi:hypothetical protein